MTLAAALVLALAAHPDRSLAGGGAVTGSGLGLPGVDGRGRGQRGIGSREGAVGPASPDVIGQPVSLREPGGVGPVRGRWPLDGRPAVVRRFSPPPTPYGRGHRGADLAAAPGAAVRAAAAGTVTFAGTVGGKGVVVVAHAGGLRTTYEPVTATAATGDLVAAGAPIGILNPGHAGCPVTACLHWGLRRGDVYLDPLALLGLGQVRLLALTEPTAK